MDWSPGRGLTSARLRRAVQLLRAADDPRIAVAHDLQLVPLARSRTLPYGPVAISLRTPRASHSTRGHRRREARRGLRIPGSGGARRVYGCFRCGRTQPSASRSSGRPETGWQPLRESGGGHGFPRRPLSWDTVVFRTLLVLVIDVNSTVVWSCPSWTPMRCVHADVPLRLPLTRECCAGVKKVGVVVTSSTRCVTKNGHRGSPVKLSVATPLRLAIALDLAFKKAQGTPGPARLAAGRAHDSSGRARRACLEEQADRRTTG